MSPSNGNAPQTSTSLEVVVGLLGIAILIWLVLNWLIFGPFFSTIIVFVIMAYTTSFYTRNVPGYFGLIILNRMTKEQRALFQGLNFVLPWENDTQMIDLRVDLKEVCGPETYASKDAMMMAKYVYTIKPDPANLLTYASFEESAIKMAGRALFSMLLSDYYSKNESENLLDKKKINKAVFNNELLIGEFEVEHGVKVTVKLEDSDRDQKTQDAKDVVSQAKSYAEAVKALVAGGMDPAQAEKRVAQMSLTGIQEHNINLAAKGVENLHDINILGLGGKTK